MTWHTHEAVARSHHSDDDEEDEDDGGDDSDESYDDSGDEDEDYDDSGDEGEDYEDGGEEGDSEADKDQPPVTAGGLFTLKSYPVSENLRPLTMTQHIAQVRVGLGTDLSAKGAFDSFGLNVEGVFGLRDNFSLIGGVTNAYNFKQFGFYFGFEGGLVYDLLDIRLAANLHRNAIPRFCDTDLDAPSNCADPTMPGVLPNLPDGNYDAGGTKFSVDLGFPVRYAFMPQFAVVALQTLISIDFNSVSKDHTAPGQLIDPATKMPILDPMTMMPVIGQVAVPNTAKPDLEPSIGLAANPIPQVQVVVYGQLRIPDFDTSAGAFQIPVTARVEASPTQKLDFGLEFTLLNIKPPEPQKPIDNRFLSLFMQARF